MGTHQNKDFRYKIDTLLRCYTFDVKISKYHLTAIIFYILVCIYFFFFTQTPSSYYSFHSDDLVPSLVLALCAFASLYIAIRILRFGEISLNKKSSLQILLTIFYGLILFGLPEEILFRGIIQTGLESMIPHITIVILLSSLVYGLAHILNGAKGLRPKDWNWKLVFITFIVGLYLGCIYFITKSLFIPTILHALFILANQIYVKEK